MWGSWGSFPSPERRTDFEIVRVQSHAEESHNILVLTGAAGRWDGQGLILISVRVSFIPVNYCHKITPIYWVWIKASLQRGSDCTSAFGTDGYNIFWAGNNQQTNRKSPSCLQSRRRILFILSHCTGVLEIEQFVKGIIFIIKDCKWTFCVRSTPG